MYPSTSSEFKSVTSTNATSNRNRHTLQGAASGSSRQRTFKSAKPTTEHSPGSSSVSEGAITLLKYCTSFKAYSPEKSGHSSSAVAVHDLKNLYCCDIPDSMMDRDLLQSHFRQFGRVVRTYLSLKRKSCTVHFDSHHSAALAKDKGTKIKDVSMKLFWSRPAKGSGRLKDVPARAVHTELPHTSTRSKSRPEVFGHRPTRKSAGDFPKQGAVQESPPRLRRARTTSVPAADRNRMRKRQLLSSRKGKINKALDVRSEKNIEDTKNIFSYPVGGRTYEMPAEVKDELDVMACNEDSKRLSDSSRISSIVPHRISRPSSKGSSANGSDSSMNSFFSSLDLSQIRGTVMRDRVEGISNSPLSGSGSTLTSTSTSTPTSTSSSLKTRTRKVAASVHQLSALQELLDQWDIKSKQEHHSAEDRYQVLELRDKILRTQRGTISDLSKATVIQGTCQDMCPEKERYQRESRHQVALYEYQVDVSKGMIMDHALAVKQYSRSSAAQEEPLPHDLRPPHVLRMTMDYLLVKLMDLCENKDENLGEWYHFLWDRTRGIRKDITQQLLCDNKAVSLVEQCARFHIHCSERLVAEDTSVFDNKINSENLTKCLQTLKYMYHDMALKGINCPNEAEFRGYVILLNLNDANFMWEIKDLSEKIINSEPVRFAIEVSLALSMNNYVRFFKLIRSATYLNACILLRYFYQVRSKALFTIVKSHCPRSTQSVLTVQDLTRWLAFENTKEAAVFCDHFGLRLNDFRTEVVLCKDSLHNPSHQLPVGRAVSLIELKRTCSVGEVVKGGTLTSETFQNYMPHCSFNKDGTIKQETLNAVNELLNLDTPGPSQQVETQESDVSDDIAKMRESETVRHQEKAIEEAETWKSNELMEDMLSEIIQEEFQIFNDRLTNVGILELDELLLDIICSMTREIYKEVVTIEKEIAKKKAEEFARKKEEERQKLLGTRCVEIMDEFLSEIMTELIADVRQKEEERLNESCSRHSASILSDVTMEECKTVVKDVIRNESLQLLLQKQQVSDLRKYFIIWRSSVRRSKLYRKFMAEFPAGISTLSLKEQVAHLETPQAINKTVAKFTVPTCAMEDMNKIPVFDIVSCELYINPKREYLMQKYFKMVVSIPSEAESPTYGWFVKQFTEKVLSSYSESSLINQSGPLMLERKLLSGASQMTVSVRCVIGPDMIEGGMSNPDAMAGTNGLIFLICHDSTSTELTRRRLHEVMQAKHHYGGIPVAFLMTDYVDSEKMKVDLNMGALIHDTGIRICEIFHRKPKCKSGLEDMFCGAIFWLAQNAYDVPVPYCATAQHVVYRYLGDALWDKFQFREESVDGVTDMKMDLELVVHIHNKACSELLKIITDETLNKCTIGAPEFLEYAPPGKMNECSSTKLYEIMPPYFGSEEYRNSLVKLLKSIEFKPATRWSPNTPEQLRNLLMEYCLQNGIPCEGFNEASMLVSVCLHHLHADSIRCNWSQAAMCCIPWIAVFKLLLKYKLRRLDFRDYLSDNQESRIMVAMNREKISTFIESQWLYYLHIVKDKGMPYPSPELQTAASDSATVGTAKCGVKRRVLEDIGVEKKRSKQLVFVNVEGVNTSLQKLSELLDECSSKQRELGQKLKTAVCGDGNLMEPVASSQM